MPPRNGSERKSSPDPSSVQFLEETRSRVRVEMHEYVLDYFRTSSLDTTGAFEILDDLARPGLDDLMEKILSLLLHGPAHSPEVAMPILGFLRLKAATSEGIQELEEFLSELEPVLEYRSQLDPEGMGKRFSVGGRSRRRQLIEDVLSSEYTIEVSQYQGETAPEESNEEHRYEPAAAKEHASTGVSLSVDDIVRPLELLADPLARLILAAAVERRIHDLVVGSGEEARGTGLTWRQIGEALGITAAGAQARFDPVTRSKQRDRPKRTIYGATDKPVEEPHRAARHDGHHH